MILMNDDDGGRKKKLEMGAVCVSVICEYTLQEFSLFPTNISYKNWTCGETVSFSEQIWMVHLSRNVSYEKFGRQCVLTGGYHSRNGSYK
jgi:hypothetical protein